MPQAKVASTPSYRVNDRRGTNTAGKPSPFAYGNNNLINGARRDVQRSRIPFLDADTHRTISSIGFRRLRTIGRMLFWNVPSVSGAIMEQAALASENFKPQFTGSDRAWGEQAESWLLEWERICDVQGWPYNMDSYRNQLVIAELREGDIGTLLTETDTGYPQIQTWPAHRIGNDPSESTVTGGGPFDGFRLCEGVILDEFRRAVGYRLIDEDGAKLADVPAQNMFLSYIPKAADQVRGVSSLASAIFDWQDLKESKSFELMAQKAAAGIALLESNETGADEGNDVPRLFAEHDAATGNKTTLDQQELHGGMYRYFKAGTNSDLKAFSYDRPGSNTMQYQDAVLRDCFAGMEWSYFFSLDPTKIGGASIRIVVDKLMRITRKRQRMVEQSLRRIHGYAISKAIKLGLLPPNDEWFKWEYQLPIDLSADKKYDSDVSTQELSYWFTTEKEECGKRGRYWQDVQDQRLAEIKRRQDKAKEMGIDLSLISVPEAVSESFATPAPLNPQPKQQNEPNDDIRGGD